MDNVGLSGANATGSSAAWVRMDGTQACEDVHAVFGHIVMTALVSWL
jgi:hypothetical protein